MMSPPPSISARVSPAQIEVLQATITGSHPAVSKPQQQHGLGGDQPNSKLPLNVNELHFTDNIATAGVPVFGNLMNNLAGVTTVPANQEVPSGDNDQQSQSKVCYLLDN